MADIIAESGLSAGAIYGYFASKNELIHESARRVTTARIEELERQMELDPMPAPPEMVRTFVAGMVRDVGDGAMLVQLWGEAVADPEILVMVQGVFARFQSAWSRYIASWLEAEHALDSTSARRLADSQIPLYLAALQGYIVQSALMQPFDADEYFAAVEAHLPR